MDKTSNVKAKISYFAPRQTKTSGLGGSHSFNRDSVFSYALHLLCDICYGLFDEEARKPYLIVPCGHPICLKCSSKLTSSKCPTCSKLIKQKIVNWGLLAYMKELPIGVFKNKKVS
jgi:hypothetical protein